jgi:hypothetical protein
MRRTDEEARWLETLGREVQAILKRGAYASRLKLVKPRSKETVDEVDGWWLKLSAINGRQSNFNLFLDNTLEPRRRSLWYGASASKRDSVEQIDDLCRRRWPHTQVHIDDADYPTRDLRYTDPVLDRWGKDEFYYGWYEPESPQTGGTPPAELAARIAERFTAVLSELDDKYDAQSLLSRLDELDGLRHVKERLEQGILRAYVLDGEDSSECALCGETFPVDLLVAAHIKRRASCTDAERRNYESNLMALCAFGCDDLFERGYIAVRGGRVIAGNKAPTGGAVKTKVSTLIGRECARWNAKSSAFFNWHRIHAGKLR